MSENSPSPYRDSKPAAKRLAESQKIRSSRPGQVPAIVEPHASPGALPPLPRNKYLVSRNYPASKLRAAIMKDASLSANGPLVRLFLRETGAELDYDRLLGSIDDDSKDADDGFLYVTVTLPKVPQAGVPYIKDLLAAGARSAAPAADAAATSSSPSADFASPHGDRVPEGATIASCTFLNPRASGKLLPELVPTCGGAVPRALYLACLLDVTAVGLVVPLLAAYSRALGAGPRFTGILQATYGLCQLVGANVLGGLSDTLGRRTMLQLSCLGGVVGYASLALAVSPAGSSLWLLLASRVPIGLLKQSLTVSRALVADATPLAGRMRPMARLGGCVGVGFVLGPGFGGVLSKRLGLHAPPLLAALLFALSSLVVTLALPESAPLPLAVKEAAALLRELERQWLEAHAVALMRAGGAAGGRDAARPAAAATGVVVAPSGAVVSATSATGAVVSAARAADAEVESARASELCLQLLHRRLPNYQASRTGSVVATLGRHSGGAPFVGWDAARRSVVEAYADWKVGEGMLHADAAEVLKARLVGGGGGGGGGGSAGDGPPALGGLLEIGRSAQRLWHSKSMPRVRRLLGARALVELSVMILHAAFADYTRTKFGWDQRRTGYGMAVSGALSVLVDVGILPALHSRRLVSEVTAALAGGLLVACGLLGLALSLTVRGFFFGLTLLSLGTSLFKSSLATLVMGLARRDEAGTISGAMDAMEAVCRVTAPLLGGVLLEHGSLEGPPAAGCVLAAVGLAAVYAVAPREQKIRRE